MISHRLSSNKVQNIGGEKSEQNLFRGTGVKRLGTTGLHVFDVEL